MTELMALAFQNPHLQRQFLFITTIALVGIALLVLVATCCSINTNTNAMAFSIEPLLTIRKKTAKVPMFLFNQKTTTLSEKDQPLLFIDATDSSDFARFTVQRYRQPVQQRERKIKQVVMKFDSSLLENANRIDDVANLIKNQIDTKLCFPRAIVCSAMGTTTNMLLHAGKQALNEGIVDLDNVAKLHLDTMSYFNMSQSTVSEISYLLDECTKLLKSIYLVQEISVKTCDQLVSYGERCSVRIIAARLNQLGIPSIALDAWDIGIHTNNEFGNAKVLPESYTAIQNNFARIDTNIVSVVTGCIAHNNKQQITTFGRSGSDISATIIGSALTTDEIVFWKDIDGILSTDPRIVSSPIPINSITYEEANDLAYFGSQEIHPIAVQTAQQYNIPCCVKNVYNSNAPGTLIRNNSNNRIIEDKRLVTAITYKRDISVVDFHAKDKSITYGFLGQVFTSFEEHKISVDVLASSKVSISVTIDSEQELQDNMGYVINDLYCVADIKIKPKKAMVTLIADASRSSDILSIVFEAFAMHNICVEMICQGFSKINISLIVNVVDLDRSIQLLHEQFFEQENQKDEQELLKIILQEQIMKKAMKGPEVAGVK